MYHKRRISLLCAAILALGVVQVLLYNKLSIIPTFQFWNNDDIDKDKPDIDVKVLSISDVDDAERRSFAFFHDHLPNFQPGAFGTNPVRRLRLHNMYTSLLKLGHNLSLYYRFGETDSSALVYMRRMGIDAVMVPDGATDELRLKANIDFAVIVVDMGSSSTTDTNTNTKKWKWYNECVGLVRSVSVSLHSVSSVKVFVITDDGGMTNEKEKEKTELTNLLSKADSILSDTPEALLYNQLLIPDVSVHSTVLEPGFEIQGIDEREREREVKLGFGNLIGIYMDTDINGDGNDYEYEHALHLIYDELIHLLHNSTDFYLGIAIFTNSERTQRLCLELLENRPESSSKSSHEIKCVDIINYSRMSASMRVSVVFSSSPSPANLHSTSLLIPLALSSGVPTINIVVNDHDDSSIDYGYGNVYGLGTMKKSVLSVCNASTMEVCAKRIVEFGSDTDGERNSKKPTQLGIMRRSHSLKAVSDAFVSIEEYERKKNMRKRKGKMSVYIAVLMSNNEEIVADFSIRMLHLIDLLGRDNVFLSVYESGSTDSTPLQLARLHTIVKQRRVKSQFVLSTDHMSVNMEMEMDRKLYYDNRPLYLAEARNFVMKPLNQDFDVALMLNDVLFDPSDVVKLLETRDGEYDMACAMDFSYAQWQIYPYQSHNDLNVKIDDYGEIGLRFYDTWVTRDTRGSMFSSVTPYAFDLIDQSLLAKGQPVPVYSCWNGVVAIKTDAWLKHGLKFRSARDGFECPSSECSVWCSDMQKAGLSNIFINPLIRVAYEKDVLQLAHEDLDTLLKLNSSSTATIAIDLQLQREKRNPPRSVACCPNAPNSQVDWSSCYHHFIGSGKAKDEDEDVGHHERINIVFEGQVFEEHSYSRVNRELLRRMVKDDNLRVRISVPSSDRKHRFALNDANMNAIDHVSDNADIKKAIDADDGEGAETDLDFYIRNSWPPRWTRPSICPVESCHFALMLPWEFGHLPKEWVDSIDTGHISMIIVPSRYVKDMYVRSGVPSEKIRVVWHGVDSRVFKPQNPPFSPFASASKSTFKFLSHGALLPRKGLDVLIKAFLLAFPERSDIDKVELILHTTYAHATQEYQDTLTTAVQDAKFAGYHIQWLEGTELSDEQVRGLYTSSDALVQAYRAEGFGLPIAEAMASGLPVIVSDKGAASDFVSNETGFLVKSVEKSCTTWPCQQPKKLCVFCGAEGCECKELVGEPYWLEPSVSDLAKQMRLVYDNREEREQRALAGKEYVADHLSWDKIVHEQFVSLLYEYE